METTSNIEKDDQYEALEKEFIKKRIIIDKNKTGEEIQALMVKHQDNIDKLQSEKIKMEMDNQNIKEEINNLKKKLDDLNAKYTTIKFRAKGDVDYPIVIDRSSTLTDAFSKFSSTILDPEYSDIKKLFFLYHGENKNNLFIQNKPISSLDLDPNDPDPILVIPNSIKFSYNSNI